MLLLITGPQAGAQIIIRPPPTGDPLQPTAAPLPTDLRLLPGTNSTLRWTSTGPASWFVEYSSDFSTWTAPTNLGTLTPPGQPDTVDLTATVPPPGSDPAPQRFYRLTRPGQPVTITAQPADRYARTNQYFFLGVSRSGDLPMIDRWYRDGTELVTFTDWPADRTAVFVTKPGAYQVVIANPWGIVTSRVANITFVDHLPARILNEPADATGFVGQFLYPPFEITVPPQGAAPILPAVPPLPGPSAGVEGDSPITFRWYRDNALILTRTNSNPPELNSYVYGTGPTNFLVSATYQLIASNAWGMATSRVATLNISQPPVTVAGGTLDLEVVYSDWPFSGPARFRLKPARRNDTCVMENVFNASGGTGHYSYQADSGPHRLIDAQLGYTPTNRPPFHVLLTYNSPTNGVFQLIQHGSAIGDFISAGKFTFTP